MVKTLLFIALLPAAALAAEPGERLYATCSACHGTNGAGSGNLLPKLAGQPSAVLAAAMRDFKSGARPATIMHQISKGYTDAQIEQITAYLARQKP